MLPVSEAYKDSINAPVRRIFGKVQIDYTDPFIDQSISINASEEANVSYKSQTADSIEEPLGKIFSLDGSFSLDDMYALAPDNEEEAESLQMGWWGSQLSDENADFNLPYPSLTVEFVSRPIRELKVVGDSSRGEWPVDFSINIYAEDDSILHTEIVTNNTSINWTKAMNTVITQVVKMELIISKWSHPGRQVKITEFFTSIQEIYQGNDILFINLFEEREVSNNSLPVGTISSNEIDIRLFNRGRKFDANNMTSPLYEMLKANRRVRAWIGVETSNDVEYIPLGVFWTNDWDVPEQNIYAHTTGRDRLELLRKDRYNTSQVQMNKTLYELAEAILIDAGLKDEDYFIDDELNDFLIPYSYFENQSHREALRKIAEACLGQVYCDREGIVRIEGPSFLESNNDPVLEITMDDYFVKNNPTKWSQIANYIEVETQPLRPDEEEEIYRSNDPVYIGQNETKTITAFYNHTPCIDAVASKTGVGTIVSATYYAWGATIHIHSSVEGAFELFIHGKPLRVLNREKAVAQDEISILENGKLEFSFPKNSLIQNVSTAQSIADKLLEYYKNPRRDIELDWRGNMALPLGDLVSISDRKGSRNYITVQQSLEFNGGLKAKLSGRKVN